MAYTVKVRTLPGSPMMSEYECPYHGRFERLVARDANGDPPTTVACDGDAYVDYPDENGMPDDDDDGACGELAELVISAANIRFWSRDPVPIGRASKSDEKDPRALDTEPLATGKMTKAEWRKWQRGISRERRHQKLLKAGKRSKRIQVDSKGAS